MSHDAIYMDYAAATPMDPSVVSAMQPFFTEQFYNPSSVYLASREIKKTLDDAKAEIAHWLGARPSEIVLTAGATEANNLALHLAIRDQAHVVTSSIEHEAILEPAQTTKHTIVAVDERGMVHPDSVREAITEETRIVSIMYANNEIGTVQHISDIAQVVAEERTNRSKDNPIFFHTDASQAPNYLDLHVDKLGVDLMTINGGKMYGPKQSGVLYVRAGVVLEPLIRGGGQEHGLRSGTENVASAAGLAAALRRSQTTRKDEGHRLNALTNTLRKGLAELFEDAEVLGHKKHRLPNITSVMIPGIDGERVVMMLDEAGVQAATGSACGALRDESSHVVKALGRSEGEAGSTLRFSLGRGSDEAHINHLLEVLPDIIKTARSL